MQFNEWKFPLNLAVGIHLAVFMAAIYLPGFLKAKPKFADIYTVSIINIAEPTAAPEAQTPPATQPIPEADKPQAPPKAKEIAPIAESPPSPAPAPQKSVSLKPLKRKIIKPTDDKEKDLRNEVDRRNRQKLASAIKEQEILAEKARMAREALEAERKLLDTKPTPPQTTQSSSTSGSRQPVAGSSSNLIESQYQAAIVNRLQQFWYLPEHMRKDVNLTAIVVVTIANDGNIANMFFEDKSGNHVYDQFVRKTIEMANPLPPIPPAMKKQRIELGLVFRPGGIQ